jgi:hypothetical protein
LIETVLAANLFVIMKDLEAIATLEYGKLIERLAQEAQEKLRAAGRGMLADSQRLQIRLEQAAQTCEGFANIWVNLLEERNGGTLTREDVTFIMEKVTQVVAARKTQLLSGPDKPPLSILADSFMRKMDAVRSTINRDLEIKLRRSQALPKKTGLRSDHPTYAITINQAANVNLGTQIGSINAALTVIAESDNGEEIVQALRELTQTIAQTSELGGVAKTEALDVVEELAKQAESKAEKRSSGKIKAFISALPQLINSSKTLLELWDKYSPAIKHYFQII